MNQPLTEQIVPRRKSRRNIVILGLVLVGIMIIFVGGVVTNEAPKPGVKILRSETKEPAQALPPGAPGALNEPGAVAPNAPAAPGGLAPKFASDFVKSWSFYAMDYAPQTTMAHHQEAIKWMTPETSQAFLATFYPQQVQQQLLQGQVSAAWQPISVQAEAVNPDGTVVVLMTGTLVMQSQNATPVTQPVAIDFLVRQQATGLQICGLNIRPATPTAPGL